MRAGRAISAGRSSPATLSSTSWPGASSPARSIRVRCRAARSCWRTSSTARSGRSTPQRAILWNDQRTAAECDTIRAAVGPQRLIEITGNDALTGFTAPKLVWVRDHEPETWRRVAHILLPKDFVRLRLTGVHAIDKADG